MTRLKKFTRLIETYLSRCSFRISATSSVFAAFIGSIHKAAEQAVKEAKQNDRQIELTFNDTLRKNPHHE